MWYGANIYTGHPRCALSTGTQASAQAPSVNSPWILTNTLAHKAVSFWQNSILKPIKKSNTFLARWPRVWGLVCDVSACGWRTREKTPGTQSTTEEVNQSKYFVWLMDTFKHFIVGSFYPGPFKLKEVC